MRHACFTLICVSICIECDELSFVSGGDYLSVRTNNLKLKCNFHFVFEHSIHQNLEVFLSYAKYMLIRKLYRSFKPPRLKRSHNHSIWWKATTVQRVRSEIKTYTWISMYGSRMACDSFTCVSLTNDLWARKLYIKIPCMYRTVAPCFPLLLDLSQGHKPLRASDTKLMDVFILTYICTAVL